MRIFNKTQNSLLADAAVVADTFFSRMVGLLDRASLDEREALIITRCQSIHMFFMRFPIDVIFADKNDRIVGLVERIRPFRLSPIFFRSSYAIELKEGTIARVKATVGDQLELQKQ